MYCGMISTCPGSSRVPIMMANQNPRSRNRNRPRAYAASRQETTLPSTVSVATMALLRKKRPNATSNLFQPSVKLLGVKSCGIRPMLLAISSGDLNDVPIIQNSGYSTTARIRISAARRTSLERITASPLLGVGVVHPEPAGVEQHHGDQADHQEEDPGHRGRVSHVQVDEARLVKVQRVHESGVDRPAGAIAEHERRREALEAVDRLQHQVE